MVFNTSFFDILSKNNQNVYVKRQGIGNLSSEFGLYFVGIGGVGMSSVARLLKNNGYAVSGSDTFSNLATAALKNIGVKINFQQNGQCIDNNTDLIVASSAIPDNNLDLLKAKSLGIKIIKFSQLLGLLMKGKRGIAVSGTHGKTTTTAIISTILRTAGLYPACVIGGDTPGFDDNYCPKKSDLFVTEACEYDRTFLNLTPQMAVITNIDEDHLDYYKDITELTSVFAQFASSICSNGLLITSEPVINILNNLSSIKCNVESYAIVDDKRKNMAQWGATKPFFKDGKTHFTVFYDGKFFNDFYLRIPGLHNVMNALAAVAICHHAGVSKDVMAKALSSFKGVDRRFQVLGSVNDITIIDDYAHHPTAIETTLKTAKERYAGKRIWCLFQPHQYSRTRLLLERFVHSFGYADKIILADIYSARDSLEDMEAVSSLDIVKRIKDIGSDVELIPDHAEIAKSLCDRLIPGDVLVVMGAGDIWKVGENVLERLRIAAELQPNC